MAKLDTTLTPRKANRAGERTKGFKDSDEHFVPATGIVDSDGNLLESLDADSSRVLELIYFEMREIKKLLTLVIEE